MTLDVAGAGGAHTPLVSVIVRSMARPTLAGALASIGAQTWPAIEVLVVAACGPSHPPIAQHAGAHAARLVERGCGLDRAEAANAGVESARGEWVIFLDDDDQYEPKHIAALMAHRFSEAAVIHSYVRAVYSGGREERIGQPHAYLELFERNYLHLAATLFRRELHGAACRFQSELDPVEDWDFMLQLAQRARFHFVPAQHFVWHADAGTSGMGAAANQDRARFDAVRERLLARWERVRDDHIDRLAPLFEAAGKAIRRADHVAAQAGCNAILAASQNNPWALNLLAMSRRAAGDLPGARAAQALAVAVRPHDAGMRRNLSLLESELAVRTRKGA